MASEKRVVTRSELELDIVRKQQRVPTVEVDLNSGIPNHGYGDIVAQALAPLAAKSPNLRATIHVYHGASVNFHEPTWSAFFGVAGQRQAELLRVLELAFMSIPGVKAKTSDYIDISQGEVSADFHIEDGSVWRGYEAGTWYCEEDVPSQP